MDSNTWFLNPTNLKQTCPTHPITPNKKIWDNNNNYIMTESTEPKSGYNNQMGKDRGRYTTYPQDRNQAIVVPAEGHSGIDTLLLCSNFCQSRHFLVFNLASFSFFHFSIFFNFFNFFNFFYFVHFIFFSIYFFCFSALTFAWVALPGF
ncbi:unnamed protein product [Camellia sinensis]